MIDIGERAGSGIPNIYDVWKKQKWNTPVLTEAFEPERIELVLPINIIKKATITGDDKKATIKTDDKRPTINSKKFYAEIYLSLGTCWDLFGTY